MFSTVEGYNIVLTRDIICQSGDSLETIDHSLYLGPGMDFGPMETIRITLSIGLEFWPPREICLSCGPQFSDPPATATTSAAATQNFN